MKRYYGYIRVSTVRQGERGSSLVEQKSAIEAYAARNALTIDGWFEEMETAAKQGRRLFNRMLAELSRGRIDGVIIHKIDRSARNLKDWAQLGEMIDAGVEVHFAHEALDLHSRGGRLSADIQAVVAADYIRNLREEVKKGFYGRLKQGLYPLPAPLGYVDHGKAREKTIDPVIGPLVREAFELYASGRYGLERLVAHMAARGLRGRRGRPISRATLAEIFHNPFYIGVIRIKRTGESFAGAHEPLVPVGLFQRVQAVAAGKTSGWKSRRTFTYGRLIRCAHCARVLVGEVQKGHAYYRCHTRSCPRVTLREDRIDGQVAALLSRLAFSEDDLRDLRDFAEDLRRAAVVGARRRRAADERDLANAEDRLARLTDAYLDGAIDRDTFEARKALLFEERQALRERLNQESEPTSADDLVEKLELGSVAQLRFSSASDEEKREIFQAVSSNLTADGEKLAIRLRFPFDRLIERPVLQFGGPHRASSRTLTDWAKALLTDGATQAEPSPPTPPSPPRLAVRPAPGLRRLSASRGPAAGAGGRGKTGSRLAKRLPRQASDRGLLRRPQERRQPPSVGQ